MPSTNPIYLFIIHTFTSGENVCRTFEEISALRIQYLNEDRSFLQLVDLTIKNGITGANEDILYPLFISSTSQDFKNLNSKYNHLHSFQVPIDIDCNVSGTIALTVGTKQFILPNSQSKLVLNSGGPTIKEEYWTESKDIWGVISQTDTSPTTSYPQSGQTFQRLSDLALVFGLSGNGCHNNKANFNNARYSFQYKSQRTQTVQLTGYINRRGSIYIDGSKIIGSTKDFYKFKHSYIMTQGVHDIVIITWDNNKFCANQNFQIDGQQFAPNTIQSNIDLKSFFWGRSCFSRNCEFINAVSQSLNSQSQLYIITTNNLNQGSDYWIGTGSPVLRPIGSVSNQFIAIQQTLSESIDYNFVYDGFCADLLTQTLKDQATTLLDCRTQCINDATCEFYYFSSSNGKCFISSDYCSPQASSIHKYYQLNQWSKNLWNPGRSVTTYTSIFVSNSKMSPITFCDNLSPQISNDDLSPGVHKAPLTQSISVQIPFKFACSSPFRYVLLKNKDTLAISFNDQIPFPWKSEELIQLEGSLQIRDIPQSNNQIQTFATGVLYGYPGSHILDQYNTSVWEIQFDKKKLNCSYNVEVSQIQNANLDNKILKRTEIEYSGTFNNETFPLPFKFEEGESSCQYNIAYGLSKTRNSYIEVGDNLKSVTNKSLTLYPGLLSVAIPSEIANSFQFAFYVEITYTQGIYAPQKTITNYQFQYDVTSKEEKLPYYIIIPCPDGLIVPEWELLNNTKINLNIFVDKNGDFDDESSIFLWTSPALIQINNLDQAQLTSKQLEKDGLKQPTRCSKTEPNEVYDRFSITMDKECLLANLSGNEGEGLYRGTVLYKYQSTNDLCATDLHYVVDVNKVNKQIKPIQPAQNFTFNATFELDIVESASQVFIPVIKERVITQELNITVEEKLSKFQEKQSNILLRLINGWKPPIKPESYNVTSYIYSITALGRIEVVFNASMNPVEISNYNSENIFIYFDKYDSFSQEYVPTLLNMTWDVVEFKEFLMTIQLNLSSPLSISQELVSDNLNVIILNNTYFYSASAHNNLLTYSMKSPIRRQIPNTQSIINIMSSAELSKSSMKVLLFLSIVMTLIFQGGMKYYVLMIRTLQLILHLQIFLIQAQGNVSMLYQILLPIANFDFEISKFLEWVIPFREDNKAEFTFKPLFQRFEQIDYSNNAIINMGSTFLVNMFQSFCLAAFVLMTLSGFLKQLKEVRKFLKFQLFQILVVVVEVYIQFLISGLLNMKYPLKTPVGEVLGLMYAGECLVFSLMLLPFYLLYTFLVPKKRFQSRKFQNRQGIIYSNEVKTSTNLEISYFTFYMFRRIVYVFISCQLEISSLQLIFILYLNLQWFIYIGLIKPKIGRIFNQIEFFNEFINQVVCFHQFFFTDLVPDAQMQYYIGWSQIFVINVFLLFNLVIILYNGFKSFQLILIKYYKICFRNNPEKNTKILNEVIDEEIKEIKQHNDKSKESEQVEKPQKYEQDQIQIIDSFIKKINQQDDEAKESQQVEKPQKYEYDQIQIIDSCNKKMKFAQQLNEPNLISTIELIKETNFHEQPKIQFAHLQKHNKIKLKEKVVKIAPQNYQIATQNIWQHMGTNNGLGNEQTREKDEMIKRFNQYMQTS